jgi:hypothetical protein
MPIRIVVYLAACDPDWYCSSLTFSTQSTVTLAPTKQVQ